MAADLVQTINGWVNDAVKDLAAEGRLADPGRTPTGNHMSKLGRGGLGVTRT